MKKVEAKFNTVFSKYILETGFFCNYELKQTPEDIIYWKVFETPRVKRQLYKLVAAIDNGYHWKHSDADPREKPFDGSFNPPNRGVVGILYGKHNKFVIIGIGEFLAEKLYSKEKSLSFTKACEIVKMP